MCDRMRCRIGAAVVVVMTALAFAPLARAGGHLWPFLADQYPIVNRVQAADRQISYKVDLSGLLFSRKHTYTLEQIAQLESACVAAFDTWNDALSPVGLRFNRVGVADTAELPVFAFDYSVILPDSVFGDTVAGALDFPANGVLSVMPIVLDNSEQFLDLRELPTIIGPTLQQPYTRYVMDGGVDIYSVLLHEIGHELGLAHPSEALQGDRNYNFLALQTVKVDASCLRISDIFGGEDIGSRRPVLKTEVDSMMAPIRLGGIVTEIPPDDLAFVAFALRNLDPDGADEMLHRAQARFAETTPFRFANVVQEFERVDGLRANNDGFDRAMVISLGQIVVGSLAVSPADPGIKDLDFFQFYVPDDVVGKEIVIDIDAGGGLEGVSWVDARVDVFDATRAFVAGNDDAESLDDGSISTVDPYLVWVPPSPGLYYLRLVSTPEIPENGSIGDYALKIGVGGAPEPDGEAELPADPSVEGCPIIALDTLELPPTCGGVPLLGVFLAPTALGMVALRLGAGRRRVHRSRRARGD